MGRPGARIYRATSLNLERMARLLRAGDIVGVPTETVYGLAADALSARACRKIFRAKRRPPGDPLIVHIASLRDLARVAEPNAAARRLAKKFWPGPLTFVLPKKAAIPDVVTAGLSSVAVRMPAHPVFRRLIRLAGRPLAAPSANPFGSVSPTTAEHVREGLGGRIAHILDGGPSRIGLESTIVDLRRPERPRLLRPGAVTRLQLERALGVPVAGLPRRGAAGHHPQVAPGLLARHYSPRTPVAVRAAGVRRRKPGEAWLLLSRPKGPAQPGVFWLDPDGNLRAAARRLFATLRRIDRLGFSRINVTLAPGGGLAEAINDRLRRAAGKPSRAGRARSGPASRP